MPPPTTATARRPQPRRHRGGRLLRPDARARWCDAYRSARDFVLNGEALRFCRLQRGAVLKDALRRPRVTPVDIKSGRPWLSGRRPSTRCWRPAQGRPARGRGEIKFFDAAVLCYHGALLVRRRAAPGLAPAQRRLLLAISVVSSASSEPHLRHHCHRVTWPGLLDSFGGRRSSGRRAAAGRPAAECQEEAVCLRQDLLHFRNASAVSYTRLQDQEELGRQARHAILF